MLAKIDSLRVKNDSLVNILKGEKPETNYWYNPKYDAEEFLDKGINNPVEFIKKSLRARPELIPLEAVLGGTMTFGNIQLLSNEWLITDYSDGHLDGRAIYKYELKDNGILKFELIKSLGPE